MSKLSYYRRIQLSFLLFIILPILTVSFFSYTLLKKNMIEKFEISNASMQNVIVGEMERTIDDLIFASHYIVNDDGLRKTLTEFADTGRIGTYEDYTRFTRIKDSFSLITSKPLNNHIRMYLVNRAGFIISPDSENLNAVSQSVLPLMSKIDPGKAEVLQWLGMLQDKPREKGTYYLARVIGDGSKPYVSVLLIAIDTAYFEQVLDRVEIGETALFDGGGNRIAGEGNVALHSSGSHSSVLRSELALDKTDWTLVHETDEESLTGQISKTFYAGMGLVLVFTLLFSVVSLLFAKQLHRPIRKLQRVARQFALGNRSMRLDVKGRDDIAELGHSFNLMLDEIEALIDGIEREQEQKRVMELEALFMQIRPHFLINTLNSIKCSLILNKDPVHSGVIDSLMSLLRAYLKMDEKSTLEEECRLLGHYVDIMRIRSEKAIELSIELDAEAKRFIVPKLALQPLVENAIVHGSMDKDELRIEVRARQVRNRLAIEIEDNGSGADPGRLDWLNRQLRRTEEDEHDPYPRVGLRNVVQRLRLTYGAAELELRLNRRGGVTAVLAIATDEHRNGMDGRRAAGG